jgi:hypothetical protein
VLIEHDGCGLLKAGIFNRRGIAAALMFGAVGVNLGTRSSPSRHNLAEGLR